MDIKQIRKIRKTLKEVRFHFLELAEPQLLSLQGVLEELTPALLIQVGDSRYFPYSMDEELLEQKIFDLAEQGEDVSCRLGIALRKENGLRVAEDEIYQVQDPDLMEESQEIFSRLARLVAIDDSWGTSDAKIRSAIAAKRSQIMDFVFNQNEFSLQELIKEQENGNKTWEEIGKIREDWLKDKVGLHPVYYKQMSDAAAKLTGAKNSPELVGTILRNRAINPEGRPLLSRWLDKTSDQLPSSFIDRIYEEFILPEIEMWAGVVITEDSPTEAIETEPVDGSAEEEGKETSPSNGTISTMTLPSGGAQNTQPETTTPLETDQPVSSSGIITNGEAA